MLPNGLGQFAEGAKATARAKGGPRYKPVSGLLARQSVSRRKVLLDESS